MHISFTALVKPKPPFRFKDFNSAIMRLLRQPINATQTRPSCKYAERAHQLPPLLALPPELRYRIYQYLGPPVAVYFDGYTNSCNNAGVGSPAPPRVLSPAGCINLKVTSPAIRKDLEDLNARFNGIVVRLRGGMDLEDVVESMPKEMSLESVT